LITTIEKGLRRRKPSAKPRTQGKRNQPTMEVKQVSSKGVRRTVSAGSLAVLGVTTRDEGTEESSQKQASQAKRKEELSGDERDALRDQVRDKLRGVLGALKGMISHVDTDEKSRDVVDRLTFIMSMENGFMWDDAYASNQLDDVAKNSLFGNVLTKGSCFRLISDNEFSN